MRRENEIVIGIFVLAGAILIGAGAYWLSDARWGVEETVVTAHFERVGQIQAGNVVTLRGVRVGQVEAVRLMADGVELDLSLRADAPLPADPLVVLQPASLFGDWQAIIVPAGQRPRATREVPLPPGRIPGVALADFAAMAENTEEIAANLRGITDRFEVAFSEGTAEDLARAISNFGRASDELVDMLARQREEFGEFSGDLVGAGEALRQAASDLDATVSRLAAATAGGELEDIFANTREATASLREVAGSLEDRSADVERSLARADSVLGHAQSLFAAINRGEGSLGRLAHDVVLYENTAAALSELRALLDDVRTNPRRYFNLSIF